MEASEILQDAPIKDEISSISLPNVSQISLGSAAALLEHKTPPLVVPPRMRKHQKKKKQFTNFTWNKMKLKSGSKDA